MLVRREEHRAKDDTLLAYIGYGFNDTTFKARVMHSTRAPEEVGHDYDNFSRDEFVPTGNTYEPFETDPMNDPML